MANRAVEGSPGQRTGLPGGRICDLSSCGNTVNQESPDEVVVGMTTADGERAMFHFCSDACAVMGITEQEHKKKLSS